jgi:hypothetical protein
MVLFKNLRVIEIKNEKRVKIPQYFRLALKYRISLRFVLVYGA